MLFSVQRQYVAAELMLQQGLEAARKVSKVACTHIFGTYLYEPGDLEETACLRSIEMCTALIGEED